jgi:2-isopropylmalate synthase
MANERILIFDTTLRDGEQAPGYSMNLEEKLRMARQLRLLGVDILEAGFAIASPGDFESVKEIAAAVDDTVVASLSRALTKDIDAAWEAVKLAKRPRIHTFLATSDLHLQYKLKMTREHALQQAVDMVAYARNLCPDVEFSCEDATRTDLDYLCQVVEAVVKAGATTINLPDTVGYSTPEDIRTMFTTVREKCDGIDKVTLSCPLPQRPGDGGGQQPGGGGSGSPPRWNAPSVASESGRGNASLEELVMNVRTRSDEYPYATGVHTEQIYPSARLLSTITGVKINPSKAIVGANAFAHESGIHQHGMMANSRTYEIMTPESVGVQKTTLILGKHSGVHALRKRLEELGYHVSDEQMSHLFEDFKNLADRKKTIEDRDLIALVENGQKPNPNAWKLVNYVVNSGNTITSTACVTLERAGKSYQEVAFGTGPVYSALRCVEKIIKHPFSLEEYGLQAVTEHRDALGEVLVKISDGTGFYRGRGVSTDVIEASILSCLSAVNHMLDESQLPAGSGMSAADSTMSFANDMLYEHSDKQNHAHD